MKIDLDELERKAKAAWEPPTIPWWRADSADMHDAGFGPDDRAHIAANSPATTIAMIGRIRELESAFGGLLAEVEERSDNPEWYSEQREVLEKGVTT